MLDFSEALELMKQGKKVTWSGWNSTESDYYNHYIYLDKHNQINMEGEDYFLSGMTLNGVMMIEGKWKEVKV